MIRIRSLFFAIPLFLLSACGMIGEDAVTIPSYIYIPGYSFVTDSMQQGSNHNRFTDMWVSDDGRMVGAAGLPTLLPILKSGNTKVRLDAGIIVSGQDNKRTAYPLVASYVETRSLKPGVTDTIIPQFRYLPNLDAKFIEDYDRLGTSLIINPTYYLPGDTVIRVNDNNALRPGNFSGKVQMAPEHVQLQLLSSTEYELPGYGSPVYLEIDINSNLPIDIGYYYDSGSGTSSLQSVLQTFPTNGWRKLYVNLTDEVSARRAGTLFKISIAFYNIDNVVPAVYIDNVKLLCLKG
jgi:hypothetical protein